MKELTASHRTTETVSIQQNKKVYGSHVRCCVHCKSPDNLVMHEYYCPIDPHQSRQSQMFCSCAGARKHGKTFTAWQKKEDAYNDRLEMRKCENLTAGY